jgi:hypothetical protein
VRVVVVDQRSLALDVLVYLLKPKANVLAKDVAVRHILLM